MYIRYCRNFKVSGRDTHCIWLYKTYTKEDGIGTDDELIKCESTRIKDLISLLGDLPEEQLYTLKRLAREREDGIVFPDGKVTRY